MQSETIGTLALALSKAQGELMGATKDSNNPFFKSKYADLYQCIEAAKEALTKNELAVIQTTRDSDKGITIITTLAHSSGEWIRGELTMNPKKDDDQGRGSSITYGRRYAYAAIVGLAQKDDDGNAASKPEQKQPKQEQTPKDNKILDQWLNVIDSFTNKTLDEYLNWHQSQLAPNISRFPAADQEQLKIATQEMQTHLRSEK